MDALAPRLRLLAAVVPACLVLGACGGPTDQGTLELRSSPAPASGSAGSASGGTAGSGSAGAGSSEASAEVMSLRQAAADSSAVTSGRIAITEDLALGTMGSMTVTSTGEFADGKFHMKVATDLGDAAGGADSGMLGAFAGMANIEQVVDGTTLYMKSQALSGMTGGSDGWLKVEVPGASASQMASGVGPASYWSMLEGAAGQVTDVGDEDLRGIATHHRQVEVDLTDWAKKVAEKANTPGVSTNQLGQFLGKGSLITLDVWVGADVGLIHKLVVPFAGKGAMGGMKMSLTVEMYDVGQPITIDVPTDATPTDWQSLMGGLTGLGGN